MTSAEAIQKKPGKTPAPSTRSSRLPWPLAKAMDFISSLRLTVVFLCLAALLVLIGTFAQVNEGLYAAQNRYFRSFFVWWGPEGASWRVPLFPGGYLIGGVLLVNLVAAHARRFKLQTKKIGIFIIHFGLILMLLGQFATDMLQVESTMKIDEGETKSYSEDSRNCELVLIDTSGKERDRVHSVPEGMLARRAEIEDEKIPFTIRVINYWPNASVFEEPPIKENIPAGAVKSGATAGILKDDYVLPRPYVKDMDNRNLPAAVVEVSRAGTSLGSFLAYAGLLAKQPFEADGKRYEIALRFARYYHPFNITLLKATHEKYRGTETPKNFASRVRVENAESKEARETMIYMNNPLRYSGMTFFQYQMGADEMRMRPGDTPYTVLQVVRNPSWLTPYLSCVLVTIGLIWQFMYHLIGFERKRRTA
jgi:hypothetical protein